jgi:hypothetical protein
MLLAIAGILVVLWLLGFIGHIGGDFVHLVLVIALIVVIYHFLTRSRTTV